MAPDSEQPFAVCSENGYRRMLSADAFGITVCLYAYSHHSFATGGAIRETYARHFHRLPEWTRDHPETGEILGAID